MDKTTFFKHYPQREKDSNKFDNGRVFIMAGSYGMAGACILNIIGARSVGSSYIDVFLPEDIYPLVAINEITAVYHPDDLKNKIFPEAFKKAKAIAIGSGMTNHPLKKEHLRHVLKNAKVPVIVDAEGLHILAEDESLYGLNKKMTLAPHLGEFSHLTGLSVDDIKANREEIAANFAKEKGVTLVLKGPDTLIVSKQGKLSINDSGNEALATAGSGDVLTGMITGLSSLYKDPYKATVDAVWLHGHLADEAIREHSKEVFDLRSYPQLADRFFFER